MRLSRASIGSAADRADDTDCPPDPGPIEVDGSVFVTGDCRLKGTEVEGNVKLFSGDSLTLRNARIDGNIQVNCNRARLRILGNEVEGNIQARGNSGGIEIAKTHA